MADIDPVAQVKALKRLAMIMVSTGLMIGVGLPVLFMVFEIQATVTLWGFDALWLAALAIMIVDFVLARTFWRRAMALEQGALQGKAAPAR
jgi:Na+-driven multidrug efflux pump